MLNFDAGIGAGRHFNGGSAFVRCAVPVAAQVPANNALSLNNTRTGVAGFYASRVPDTLTVAGVVAKAGVAVAGVGFTAAGTSPSGSAATCTTSASNGAWSCSVPLDWSGSITPKLTGATFTPATLNFSGLLSSQTNQNFTKN